MKCRSGRGRPSGTPPHTGRSGKLNTCPGAKPSSPLEHRFSRSAKRRPQDAWPQAPQPGVSGCVEKVLWEGLPAPIGLPDPHKSGLEAPPTKALKPLPDFLNTTFNARNRARSLFSVRRTVGGTPPQPAARGNKGVETGGLAPSVLRTADPPPAKRCSHPRSASA